MTDTELKCDGLTRFQIGLWYAVLAWFGLVCLVHLFDAALARAISFWGVGFVVVMTVARIVYLSELFRRAGRRGSWLLTYVLILVLALTLLLEYLT